MRDPGIPELAVVVPVYNEEESLPLLHERLTGELSKLGRSYELVYVDDGSHDRSAERLREIAAGDPHVRVIRFRRNFGQTAALQAGIDHSRAEVLVFIDADLQNDPADIGTLLDRLEAGYDVVSGWRRKRQDPFFSRKLPSMLANWLISKVTGVALRDYGCTLKAYRREVLSPVRLYGEMHRFLPALVSWSGAEVTEIPVNHHERRYGKSKYGISRTTRVLFDLTTVKFLNSYASKPIYLFGTLWLLCWVASFFCGVYVIVAKFLPPYPQAHNQPLLLLAVLLAVVGVQSLMLGLLAEIGVRTYHESQGKPTYVVREVLGMRASDPTPAADAV